MESPLPTYTRHGEQGLTLEVDWLHCESIAERSRLHDWEIRPHRHQSLFQLFWIEQGGCELSLDGVERSTQGPCVFILPPHAVHGFRFEPTVQGLVITVLDQHINKLLSAEPRLEELLRRADVLNLTAASAASLTGAAAHLREEFLSTADWRSLGIDTALMQLLLHCGRLLAQQELPNSHRPAGRALEHVQRFRALIEQQFRQQPALGACAAGLGISATQLNRVCQQVLDCSASSLMQGRVLLEAQRELAYTSMSVKQIAHGLGFADAAYFTRFYQRQTGLSPTEWRQRATHRPAQVKTPNRKHDRARPSSAAESARR
ncbi:helix-turn-helix domain-containing protein [Paucibacter sp. PLA-PC-4]|uniref:helix-turn-helix domain-containing protein n=1 Tax=Paucibacter sp. PLA-PC-4 TaxID=2993655 RepID=UPI00224A9977|nr:helix-turn-helix domain-containing protein [Paucibacter sp. PLA-PC-4]MCX2865674.1 helix-turn-helix domain-containing protein [Paucibacter sp. PLA-PC-4]